MADFHGAACLPANLNHFLHAVHHAVALAPYMGGHDPAVTSHRLQQPGKLIRCTVAFRKVHDAHGHARGPLLHGILHQGPGLSHLLVRERGVGKSLDRYLHFPGPYHGPKVHRKPCLIQRFHIVMIGADPVVLNGPQHRLIEFIHLLCAHRVRAGRRHGDAAVAHHGGCNALGQQDIPKIRAVKWLGITVAVYVNESGRHRPSCRIHHQIRFPADGFPNPFNPVIFYIYISLFGCISQAVVYQSVFY